LHLHKIKKMKNKRIILQGLLIILIMSSCATQKLTKEGKTAYQSNNYEAALNAWDQVIEKYESRGNKAEATLYYKAGLAAKKLEQTSKARKYLETAENMEFSSPKLYIALSEIYKTIDNLSKEIIALEDYHEKYPQGDKIDTITIRLFGTYVQSENWNPAIEIWPEIEEQAQNDVDLLSGYLTVNKNLENEKVSKKLADKILNQQPKNITALEWYGEYYFWKAENLYVKEMTAYKNNRTTSQYKKVLKALDEVYPTFEKARNVFLKLYKLDPKPKYADLLGKIYTRLDEEKKARYYNNKAN